MFKATLEWITHPAGPAPMTSTSTFVGSASVILATWKYDQK
jgi:hypothetical protein